MPHFVNVNEPALRFEKGRLNNAELLEPLIYVTEVEIEFMQSVAYGNLSEEIEIVKVPVGFKTDFASIPRVLWRVMPPVDIHRMAAIVHDWLYSQQVVTRKTADLIFEEAMGVLGVPWWKRKLMYWGVRSGGWVAWRGHAKRLAQVVALLMVVLASGCYTPGAIVRQLKDDGAIVRAKVGTPWGVQDFLRVGESSNRVTIHPDGRIEISPCPCE